MAMSSQATSLLEKVMAKTDLTEEESASILNGMASGALPPALAGGLLVALRTKGEATSEIRGFANAMRELAIKPSLPDGESYVDIVGTGGDGSGSLNLSTGSALLAAVCGAKVLKHGNRSVSSLSGSADVLKALGLPVPMDERQIKDCLDELGFTFLFAPSYHPAMKAIAPVRQALGVRTVFNILGPLANPACPPFHVIGAYSESMAELMANTLSGLDAKRSFVVHGAPGWDEPTPVGPFLCFDVRPGSVTKTVRDPADYGLARCKATDLEGGTPEENAKRLRSALCNGDSNAHREALILGAALALEVTGAVSNPESGVHEARSALNDGYGKNFIEQMESFGQR
tara:strand:- start:4328 stop:5359 length:1032 start_codon:yes stop_codon:yes gene_type:complete